VVERPGSYDASSSIDGHVEQEVSVGWSIECGQE
jgi:hypothetical protein